MAIFIQAKKYKKSTVYTASGREAISLAVKSLEKAIMDSIEALSGKKTMLIIVHRLTTIQNCDYVYRIKTGEAVLERGGLS